MNKEAINLMTFLDDHNTADACTIRPQFNEMNDTVENFDKVCHALY